MELRFETTMEDLYEFNLHHAGTSPAMRKTIWGASWGVGLCLGILGLCVAALTQNVWHLYLISGAGLLYVACYKAVFKPTLRKQVQKLYAEGKLGTVLGPKVLRLEENSLFSSSETAESRFKYASLGPVVQTEAHAFIYTAPIVAIVIPYSRCTAGSPQEFLASLQAKIQGGSAP